MSELMASLRRYFTIEDAPSQPDLWLIVCPTCGEMWHLKKINNHPGNVLHLLNHARGHRDEKAGG